MLTYGGWFMCHVLQLTQFLCPQLYSVCTEKFDTPSLQYHKYLSIFEAKVPLLNGPEVTECLNLTHNLPTALAAGILIRGGIPESLGGRGTDGELDRNIIQCAVPI